MHPDDRPVLVRTSASANDFWCRPRSRERPESRARQKHTDVASSHHRAVAVAIVDDRDTPYGRQNCPFWISANGSSTPGSEQVADHAGGVPPRRPLVAVPAALTNSRIAERRVYKSTLAQLEGDVHALKRRNAALEKHFKSALKVNKALAAQMSEMRIDGHAER